MTIEKTDDIRIQNIREVILPSQVHNDFPVTEKAAKTTCETRKAIHHILHGEDKRLLVIIGPCSIHDPKAAKEYAQRLLGIRESLDQLLIVMRVYFEKPRTSVGWKGLINDPDLDGSFHINKGLGLARCLLRDINDMGMPAGTEYLDLITPQYVADLISWGAIGARTTESQVHRELASGLSCPVGFKNSTDGDLRIAIDAIRASTHPHHFLSLTKDGHSAIFSTTGNEDCHLILRGGKTPNYSSEHVNGAAEQLSKAGQRVQLMVDFSHANSDKQFKRQIDVGNNVAEQISKPDHRIVGVMIESNLIEGRQDITSNKQPVYGQSITDACLGWDDSVTLLHTLNSAVRTRKQQSSMD